MGRQGHRDSSLEWGLTDQEDLEFGPEAMAELGEVITVERLPYAAPLFLSGGMSGARLSRRGSVSTRSMSSASS